MTAANGYTTSEVAFLNNLSEVDAGLVRDHAGRTLLLLGKVACADFGHDDDDRQVVRAETAYLVGRASITVTDREVAELVPIAAAKLCPAFLSEVTTGVA